VSTEDDLHRVLEWTGVAEGRWVGGEGVILYCDGKVNVTPDVVGVAVSYWQSSCSCTSTVNVLRAGIFKESMGARHRGGIGLSYRPARLHRLAELIPWNRFLGSINV
jgi:hypothetical protein